MSIQMFPISYAKHKGVFQTEVTVSKDETSNVSCFNRVVKTCENALPIIINCAVFATSGAFVGFCGGLVGQAKASTICDMPPISLDSERELEIANRSIDLIDHNKYLIMQTTVISNAVVSALAYLLYTLVNK